MTVTYNDLIMHMTFELVRKNTFTRTRHIPSREIRHLARRVCFLPVA